MREENLHIKNLLKRFRENTITETEFNTLMEYIGHQKNEAKIKAFLEDHWEALDNINQDEMHVNYSSKELLASILDRIKENEVESKATSKRSLYKWYGIAASVVLIISLTLFINRGDKSPRFVEPIIVNNQIKTGTDKATLTLEDGKVVTLEKGTTYQTPNATSNGEEIIYNAGERNKKEIAYNTLTIPHGGQYNMVLADGTKVWLNSESQIRYPIAFNEGEARQVELIYGEAYFEVSPSTEHKGSKFKVHHHAQDVEVLGTEFNIKAYKEETNIYTTLVEGKVSVSSETNNRILKPTEQSNLNIKNGNMTTKSVDVRVVTSWKDGKFIFSKMPLKEIMKVLSRWYDMEAAFKEEKLKSIILTGAFKKSQSIEEIMAAIQNTNYINSYEIHNKTITIK